MPTVLLTGCSSGIGAASARLLAARGHTVIATARRIDTLAPLAEAGCRTLALDVTDEASITAAVDEAGPVDALVNNAGYGEYGPVEEVPIDAARREFETNLFGPARLAQLLLPHMREQGWGRIVNMSSMGGRFTLPGGGWYHASKHALESLTDALRFEVAGFGVGVVLIEPGPITTNFATTAVGEQEAPTADTDGPYGPFNQALADTVHSAYTGSGARFAAPPEAVAAVVAKAIEAKRPKARYPVTAYARVLIRTRKWLPDRGWDAVMRSQFTSPRPAG